jgi:hypothetical protein
MSHNGVLVKGEVVQICSRCKFGRKFFRGEGECFYVGWERGIGE